jgi:hypothetical protein
MEILVMIVLGLIVAGYVLVPLERSHRVVAYDWDGSDTGMLREERRAALESEILAYRAALRAGTVCARCGFANAEDGRFCAECGRPLANVGQQKSEPEPVSG